MPVTEPFRVFNNNKQHVCHWFTTTLKAKHVFMFLLAAMSHQELNKKIPMEN